jgi:hypothetical protein
MQLDFRFLNFSIIHRRADRLLRFALAAVRGQPMRSETIAAKRAAMLDALLREQAEVEPRGIEFRPATAETAPGIGLRHRIIPYPLARPAFANPPPSATSKP